MISDGRYRARAVGEVVLGESSEKKTPFIEFYFQITEGENKGGQAKWSGYFGPKSSERTIEALGHCGWKGEDLSEFADNGLHGLDANEVEVVIELEEYENKDGEKKTSPRVAWVNALGGRVNVDNAMAPDAAASFGERMKGLVLKVRERKPNGAGADEFPHGANAPAPAAAASGPRKSF
jgi:hypothetical protein